MSRNDFDELADLFLGHGGSDGAHAEPDATSVQAEGGAVAVRPVDVPDEQTAPSVVDRELVVAGNLPVMSGIWLVQLAERVAREAGSVLLVRTDGSHCAIDLVGVSSASLPTVLTDPDAGGSDAESLLRALRPYAGTVMIVPENAATIRLDRLRGIDRVHILTGADEVALVESYRLLKALHEPSSDSVIARIDRSGARVTDVSVSVAGVPVERAVAIVSRLQRTGEGFLPGRLRFGERLQRVDAIAPAFSARTAFRADRTLDEVIALTDRSPSAPPPGSGPTGVDRDVAIDRTTGATERGVSKAPTAASPASIDAVASARRVPGELPSTIEIARRVAPRSQQPKAHAPRSPSSSSSVAAPARVLPAPAITPQVEWGRAPAAVAPGSNASPGSRRSSSGIASRDGRDRRGVAHADVRRDVVPTRLPVDEPLSFAERFVQLQSGWCALSWRCPDAPDLVPAVDDAGRLHLVTDGSDWRALRVALAWVRREEQLIRIASERLAPFEAVPPALDLVVDNAELVADLHGAGLDLHLLAAVDVDGRRAWAAHRLNRRVHAPA